MRSLIAHECDISCYQKKICLYLTNSHVQIHQHVRLTRLWGTR